MVREGVPKSLCLTTATDKLQHVTQDINQRHARWADGSGLDQITESVFCKSVGFGRLYFWSVHVISPAALGTHPGCGIITITSGRDAHQIFETEYRILKTEFEFEF